MPIQGLSGHGLNTFTGRTVLPRVACADPNTPCGDVCYPLFMPLRRLVCRSEHIFPLVLVHRVAVVITTS